MYYKLVSQNAVELFISLRHESLRKKVEGVGGARASRDVPHRAAPDTASALSQSVIARTVTAPHAT